MLYDVIIIGGGAAGLGAALYSARYSLKTLIIAKDFGGTGNIAYEVNNWIGAPNIKGPDLMNKFISHIDKYKVQRIEEEVTEIKKLEDGNFYVKADKTYKSKTIIYALGMKHRELNVKGEKEYSGKGIHYCYTCDGPLYSNKIVAIVGGSDSAGLGALFLTGYAKKVYVLYRKAKLRAEPVTANQVYKHPKIEVMHNVNVTEFFGEQFLKSVKLDNKKSIELDGVFIEIGHIPISDIAKKLNVKLDKDGFIEVDRHQKTNIKGFCAAGDLTNKHTLKQFITSAEEGSVAAETVYKFITQNKW